MWTESSLPLKYISRVRSRVRSLVEGECCIWRHANTGRTRAVGCRRVPPPPLVEVLGWDPREVVPRARPQVPYPRRARPDRMAAAAIARRERPEFIRGGRPGPAHAVHERPPLHPGHRMLLCLLARLALRHQPPEGGLRSAARPPAREARRRGVRDHVRPPAAAPAPDASPAPAVVRPELGEHTVQFRDCPLPSLQLVLQVVDGLLVLQPLRRVELLEVGVFHLERLVRPRHGHAPAPRLVRSHEELLQQELRVLLRDVDLLDEALAYVGVLEVAVTALLRKQGLHARLRHIRPIVVGDDELGEVIFPERSTARWTLAAALEVRVSALFSNERFEVN